MVPDQFKHIPECCGNLPYNNDTCSQEQMLEKIKHDAVKCTDKTAKKIVFSKFNMTENNNIQAVDTYHGNHIHTIDGDNPNFCIGLDVDENMEMKLIYCQILCKKEPCIRYVHFSCLTISTINYMFKLKFYLNICILEPVVRLMDK